MPRVSCLDDDPLPLLECYIDYPLSQVPDMVFTKDERGSPRGLFLPFEITESSEIIANNVLLLR